MKNIGIDVFHIQKDGNTPEEYEDAYAINYDELSFALADGATDSCFSKLWADLLVENCAQKSVEDKNLESWLEPIQLKWHSNIDWKNLPWYIEEKTRFGAFSTLLSARIIQREGNSYLYCLAVGDTCLFLIRNNNLEIAFPIANHIDFTNTPDLLCSYKKNNRLPESVRSLNATLSSNDLIIMATDAFAKWFLEESDKGNKPWLLITKLNSISFNDMVSSLRSNGAMRNDDTTVITVLFNDL